MSRSVAFDNLDEALAAYRLGPVTFTCAVCGRRHSIRDDNQLPSTADSCVRALDTFISSALVYNYTISSIGASQRMVLTVPPVWSLLHCGLPDGYGYPLCYASYCGGCRPQYAVPLAAMLMLKRSVFVEEAVARRRAARVANNTAQREHKITCGLSQRLHADLGGIDMHYVGPPRLPLPVKLDFRDGGTVVDADGAQVRLPLPITWRLLRAQIQQMYWPAYAFTDKGMSLTRDKLIGAILEPDRMVLIMSGENKARTKHCTVAYPVIGYELMMPWRLWGHEVALQDNLVDRVVDALWT